MSWEPSVDGTSVGIYRGKKTGTTKYPISAIVAYIIDKLDEKLGTIPDRVGELPVEYFWFNPNHPKDDLTTPAVGLSLVAREREKFNIHLRAGQSRIDGSLMDGELSVYIIADSQRQKEELSSRIFRVLNKAIHVDEDTPIFYLKRTDMGYDGGFRATYSFDFPAIFQTVTEDKYIKIDIYTLGYAENYVEEDDPVDWGMIGNIDSPDAIDGTQITYYTNNISLSVSFTPNLT